jgi:Bacterial mobilisation protein (MobC)
MDRVHLTTWIDGNLKQRFSSAARAQGISESALLRRLVEASLPPIHSADEPIGPMEPLPVGWRISVRLRADDLLLLRERAVAREMPVSTYVSLLVRSHLRSVAPLPTTELAALKRSLAEVGAIGRNLNQIARAANEQQWPNGPDIYSLQRMLQAIAALRDHFKRVITANLASWNDGYERTGR